MKERPFELQPGDRLLVSRTDRLGDLILALPLVETLKRRYPECEIDVLASLYASPILENNLSIDGIVRVQNDQVAASRQYRKELQQKIVRRGYRAVVVLFPERRISRLLFRAGIPHRIGTAGRFHSVFFNHHLFHSRKANRKHELEYNLDFLEFFRPGDMVTRPRVYPTEKEREHAKRILTEAGVGDRFVVLHPGSGGSAHQWPESRFLALYTALGSKGIDTVLTGSAEEHDRFNSFAAKSGITLRTVAGQTDLRTLAALLQQASLVTANSTGPLHLAAAVGTRVVGLYPRQKVMSPIRWGPCGESHRIIQPAVPECDCAPESCTCMETITVARVLAEILDVFNEEMYKTV